jgi:sporulation protein YlmC with PRC-barrel domain
MNTLTTLLASAAALLPAAQEAAAPKMEPTPFVLRHDQVLGAPVTNPRGASLGAIREIVLGSNGELTFAILALPGEGAEARFGALPWPLLRFHGQGAASKVMAGLEPDRLREAPSFAAGEWPALDDEWWKEAEAYFAEELRIQPRAVSASNRREASTSMHRLTSLAGREVLNPDGEPLGRTVAFALDPVAGTVNYVALGLLDGATIAVPCETLGLGYDEERQNDIVTCERSAEDLADSPAFDSEDASCTKISFCAEVYRAAGVEPYWSESQREGASAGSGDSR